MIGTRALALPVADAEFTPRSSRAWLMTCVTAILSGIIIWATWSEGISRGMDHVASFGPQSEQVAISIALSESVYGLDLGYLGYASVQNKLVEVWNRGAAGPYAPVVLKNDRNRELLNEALHAAASLGPQRAGFVSDRSLITTMYDDQGSVDYVKLSFALFGLRIEAMYHMFFVILTVTAVLFLVGSVNSISAQSVLLVTLFAFLLELQTGIFNNPGMPTFTGLRHGSTLCLIPLLHFVFLIVERRRVSWLSLLMAGLQLAVLLLAIRIRGSASWALIFLGGVACVSGLRHWKRDAPSPRAWRSLVAHVLCWPFVLIVVGTVANAEYLEFKRHPVYSTDDITSYHGLWHSAYIGLEYTPELYGFKVPAGYLGGDALGEFGALEYARRIHFFGSDENGYRSPWTGNPKYHLHDQLLRRAIFQIAREHPYQILELYLFKKPAAILDEFRRLNENVLGPNLRRLIGLAGFVIAVIWMTLGSLDELRHAAAMLVPTFLGALLVSVLPDLWAYPAIHTISDTLLLLFAATCLTLGLVLATPWMLLIKLASAAAVDRSAVATH